LKSIERLRKEVKTKFFWAAWGFAGLITGITYIGWSNPGLWYFQAPFAVMILGTLPAMAGTALSVRIASIMLWTDKYIFHIFSRDKIRYSKGEQSSESISYRKFAAYNLWYTFGLIFLILRSLDIAKTSEQSLVSITMSFALLALIFGSGINLAIFLMRKRTVFCENIEDSSKVNLSSSYRGRINAALGPIQIIFFVYTFSKETNFYPLFIILGWTVLFFFVSSLTSYFILKRHHHIDKLAKRFEDKNIKFFNSYN